MFFLFKQQKNETLMPIFSQTWDFSSFEWRNLFFLTVTNFYKFTLLAMRGMDDDLVKAMLVYKASDLLASLSQSH